MTVYYPGPHEIRLFYTVTLSGVPITHLQKLNCNIFETFNPGVPFSSIHAIQKNGSNVQLDTAVNSWIVLMGALYTAATCTFNRAELWKYTPNTFEAIFLATYDINVAAGGSSGATDSGQKIQTFRTGLGNAMRLSFMEPGVTPGNPVLYTSLAAPDKAITDFVLGVTGWFIARDGTFPYVFNKMFPGTNEATFKQRHRVGV